MTRLALPNRRLEDWERQDAIGCYQVGIAEIRRLKVLAGELEPIDDDERRMVEEHK